MKPVVAINDPCHESWEKMNPEEKGRFCGQCCKVVVDFTKMSNADISGYLQQHSAQKTCGRFTPEQVVALPQKKFRFSFNVQRFAAAVFIAFGAFLFTGCSSIKPNEPQIMGDIAYVPDTIVKHAAQHVDTLHSEQRLMGEPALCPDLPENTILGLILYTPEEHNEP